MCVVFVKSGSAFYDEISMSRNEMRLRDGP
jgi:hypothetical protein